LTLAAAESVASFMAVSFPESGVRGLPEGDHGEVLGSSAAVLTGDVDDCDALLVGPGLDDAEHSKELLRGLTGVVGPGTAIVLDAFAFAGLGTEPELVDRWRQRLVLTPNPKELRVLLNLDSDRSVDHVDAVRRVAARLGAVVSSQNVIATPEGKSWQCVQDCIGLGTSGSGDVLAGAVLGLLGRGASAEQAACWATFLHLSAGIRLTARIGAVGFLASELLPELPVELENLSRPV